MKYIIYIFEEFLSEPQLHIGFTVFKNFLLHLHWLSWFKFSAEQLSNLMSLLSWTKKIEYPVLTKLSNTLQSYTGEGNDFISSHKLFHSWEQCGISNSWSALFCSKYYLLSIWFGRLNFCRYNLKYLGKIQQQFCERNKFWCHLLSLSITNLHSW